MPTPRIRANAGAVFALKVHLVWCPKYRRRVLIEPVAARLRDLLLEKAQQLDTAVEALEVRPDHVHLFVSYPPHYAVAHLVNQLKGYTSRVLRHEFPALRSRLPSLWSRAYYAGSVGHVSEATVRRYLEAQKGR